MLICVHLCPSVSICGSLRGTVSRSVRSLPKSKSKSGSKSKSKSIPVLFGTAWPSNFRSSLAAESCQHRNNATRFLQSESHSPPPSLLPHRPLPTAISWKSLRRLQEIHFSTTDNHRSTQIFPNSDLCPSVSICGSLRGTVSRSVRSLFRNRNRNRDRNRNRFLYCRAPALCPPLNLPCRATSTPPSRHAITIIGRACPLG
jgi:hypothetical protein